MPNRFAATTPVKRWRAKEGICIGCGRATWNRFNREKGYYQRYEWDKTTKHVCPPEYPDA